MPVAKIASFSAPDFDSLDAFTKGYVVCSLWSSVGDGEEGEITDETMPSDISPSTLKNMIEDCKDFQESQKDLLAKAYEKAGYDESHAGHDFWLTRCGHGAGFWDRGLGEVGDKLTKAAKVYGNIDLYLGDDGKVY